MILRLGRRTKRRLRTQPLNPTIVREAKQTGRSVVVVGLPHQVGGRPRAAIHLARNLKLMAQVLPRVPASRGLVRRRLPIKMKEIRVDQQVERAQKMKLLSIKCMR